MERVLQVERERAAVGRKQEAAQRPASYKSSLSLAMPVGTTRQKDKREQMGGEDRKLHVTQTNTKQVEKAIVSDQTDNLRREADQARLRDMYGDASASGEA